MTEKFDPWMRASSLATLLRSHRCAEIDRRLRQGAALGDIQAKARIAKLRRRMGAEWESEWTKEVEERDWEVPASIWTGFQGAKLSLSTDEYYSGLLNKDTGFTQAALIGLSFDRQQALDFFGVETGPTIVEAVVIPAAPQIEGPAPVKLSPADRNKAYQELADRFDAEKIGVRFVDASKIAERWDRANGDPPARDAITSLMKGQPKGRPPAN